MSPGQTYRPPSLRDYLQAALLAAVCSVLFLRAGLFPSNALVPYPPEALEPARTQALAAGNYQLDDLLIGNSNFGDKYFQALTWDRISRDRMLAGEWPLWTRDIAGGASFVPQMGQIYQPWNLLLLLVPSTAIYGIWFFIHQILFGLFGYGFLRRISVSHAGSLIGVACMVIGLWVQARIHHDVIFCAGLPLFAMLSCVHHLFRHRGRWRTVGLLGLSAGICWLGGMPQISLLATYLVLAFTLLLLLANQPGDRLRPACLTGTGMAIGGVMCMGQMAPVLLASMDTARATVDTGALAIRGLEFDHLLTLIWPDLLHWPQESYYAGSIENPRFSWASLLLLDDTRLRIAGLNYPETAVSIGIPALILAAGAFGARQHRPMVKFFSLACVAGMALAMALPSKLAHAITWLPDLAMIIPGGAIGDPKRWIFLAAISLPVLAAIGFDRLRENGIPRSTWIFCGTILATSAALLAIHLSPIDVVTQKYAELTTSGTPFTPEMYLAGIAPGEAATNLHALQTCFLHAFLVALATIFFLLRLRRTWAAPAIIALIALDLVSVGAGPVVAVPRARVETPPKILAPAIEATRAATEARPRFQRLAASREDPSLYPLLGPNLGAFFGLEDLAAYNPLPPRRMEDFFLAIEPNEENKRSVVFGGVGVNLFRKADSLTHPLLDLLGIRWILSGRELSLPGHVDRTPPDTPGEHRLYERTSTLPRATFVTRARIIEAAERRLELLSDRDRDPALEVILEDPTAEIPANTPAEAEITILSHTDETVVIEVRNTAGGYLRLADPYDSGWTVTVDDEAKTLHIADHYLRAVWLDPSTDPTPHRVEFRYDAASVIWPARLTLFGYLLCLGLMLFPRRKT